MYQYGCMYVLLKTSFALLAPTVLSFFLEQYDVAATSSACLIISILNHRVKGQNHLVKHVDIAIQHGAGFLYTMNGILLAITRRNVVYAIPSIMALTLAVVYWRIIHHIPCTSNMLYKHAVMHVLGSLCICCYSIINHVLEILT